LVLNHVMQIIVLGSHRSGTSLVTRLINMMGAYFAIGDTALGANIENPKGFWERWDVIAANDELLKHYGCEWDKLQHWTFVDAVPKKEALALKPIDEKIKKIILELDANRPWVIKDPRMCLTFPYWKQHLEVPVIVAVYRNPLEIARSLKTRNEFSFSHSMALWEYYATGIVNAVKDTPTVWVSHEEMLSNPIATVQKLYDDLSKMQVTGLRMPNDKEITSFIDPSLYRSKDKKETLDEMITDYQKRMMGYVSAKDTIPKTLQQPTELAMDLMQSLQAYRTLNQKMEAQNQKFSSMQQQQYELEAALESLEGQEDRIAAKYKKLIDKEKAEQEFLRNSTSWKIGHAIVNFFRTVTFTKSSAE
jgi:hypothetical protein